ncbi:MAG: hypothetical protein ACRD0Y_12030 [Terriglobales bacterium]
MAAETSKAIRRQSVALPAATARRIKALARERHTSASRVLAQMVEQGLEAEQARRAQFLDLAQKFRSASDPGEVERLGDQLGRMAFGG